MVETTITEEKLVVVNPEYPLLPLREVLLKKPTTLLHTDFATSMMI